MENQDLFLDEAVNWVSQDFPHCLSSRKDLTLYSQDGSVSKQNLRAVSIENPKEGVFHTAIIIRQVDPMFPAALLSLIQEILSMRQGISIQVSNPILGSEVLDNRKAVFSKHVYLYTTVAPSNWGELVDICKKSGMELLLRDSIYRSRLKALEKREAFLCHDSSDKDFVEALALELLKRGISPWLDKMCISPGDSITDAINEGLKHCKCGVIILSPAFTKNKGWARREFKSFLQLRLSARGKKCIPVWRGIGYEEMLDYDPEFSDICAERVSPPPIIDPQEIKKLADSIANCISR